MNKLLISLVLLAFIGFWSCSSGEGQEEAKVNVVKVNNDTQLGLINADVHDDQSDNLGGMPTYSVDAAGTSQRMDRSFENAPPMIPHSTDGLIPITKDLNACTTCHMPNVAESMKSTAIPISHLTNYRPDVNLGDGKIDIEASKAVTQIDLKGELSMARYNCTQCHVSQANVDIAIQNTFKSVFRKTDSKSGSDLNDNIGEGVK